jgi:hypothetical protein
MPDKTSLISVRDLPKVVDAAVKAAHARLGTADESGGPLIKKWEIYGKVARDAAHAQSFAAAVSSEVAKHGMPVDPAVLIIDKHIWCGFVERINVPVERNF